MRRRNGELMSTKVRSGQAGFSLVELMVAMVVTLIVSGAIYGLLAKGRSSGSWGSTANPNWQLVARGIEDMQVEYRHLDPVTGAPMTTWDTNPPAAACDPANPSADCCDPGCIAPTCVQPATCHYGGGHASHVTMRSGGTNVPENSVILVFMTDGTWVLVNANSIGGSRSGAGDCPAGQDHADLSFNTGNDTTGLNQSSGLCAGGGVGTASTSANCVPIQIGQGEVVRYRIRSSSGSWGSTANPNWQLVARGIEDMQVEYRHLDPVTGAPMTTWDTNPPAAACDPANPSADCCDPGCIAPTCVQPATCTQPTNAGYGTLITETRVTLSARSEALNIEGAQQSATSGNRIRGSLTATTTPRMALFALSKRPVAAGGPLWK
ncbi:MAG: hypothetical protein DMF80_08680 [Acidobacteria bacterium]|nr:MAG: hypothetical protein DMF80_08680 [Acidobacteriota bacterium]